MINYAWISMILRVVAVYIKKNHAFMAKLSDKCFYTVGFEPHVHVHPLRLHTMIQISSNLGKNVFGISCLRKIAVTWIWARVFAYLTSFFSQILDLIYWTVWIFTCLFVYFEWRDIENQQSSKCLYVQRSRSVKSWSLALTSRINCKFSSNESRNV